MRRILSIALIAACVLPLSFIASHAQCWKCVGMDCQRGPWAQGGASCLLLNGDFCMAGTECTAPGGGGGGGDEGGGDDGGLVIPNSRLVILEGDGAMSAPTGNGRIVPSDRGMGLFARARRAVEATGDHSRLSVLGIASLVSNESGGAEIVDAYNRGLALKHRVIGASVEITVSALGGFTSSAITPMTQSEDDAVVLPVLIDGRPAYAVVFSSIIRSTAQLRRVRDDMAREYAGEPDRRPATLRGAPTTR